MDQRKAERLEQDVKYVSHAEFSDFKEEDRRWKSMVANKLDAIATSQSWRNMLPLVSVLVVVGGLVVFPINQKMTELNDWTINNSHRDTIQDVQISSLNKEDEAMMIRQQATNNEVEKLQITQRAFEEWQRHTAESRFTKSDGVRIEQALMELRERVGKLESATGN